MNVQLKWVFVFGLMLTSALFAEGMAAQKLRVPAAGGVTTADSPTNPAGTRRDEGDFVTEKRSDGSTVKYKKKTSYDFEGANIDGMYNKPSGSYISNIKDVKAKSIIRIRENFDSEVIDSSRLVK